MGKNWVEIVGLLAVVASLLFVGYEIRENTRLAKADISKDLYLASREMLLGFVDSDERRKAYKEVRELEAKSSSFLLLAILRQYELQRFLAEEDLIDEDLWRSYQLTTVRWLTTEPAKKMWETYKNRFEEDFRMHVDDLVLAHEKQATRTQTNAQ